SWGGLAEAMEHRFIGDALRVAGDGGKENIEAAQLVMLQRVDMLGHAGRGWPAELKREELNLRRRIALFYLDEFKRKGLGPFTQQPELGVQLLGKTFAVETFKRYRHGSDSLSNHIRRCQAEPSCRREFGRISPSL